MNNTLITQYYQPVLNGSTTTFYEDDHGRQLCKCSCGRVWDGCTQCNCVSDYD